MAWIRRLCRLVIIIHCIQLTRFIILKGDNKFKMMWLVGRPLSGWSAISSDPDRDLLLTKAQINSKKGNKLNKRNYCNRFSFSKRIKSYDHKKYWDKRYRKVIKKKSCFFYNCSITKPFIVYIFVDYESFLKVIHKRKINLSGLYIFWQYQVITFS